MGEIIDAVWVKASSRGSLSPVDSPLLHVEVAEKKAPHLRFTSLHVAPVHSEQLRILLMIKLKEIMTESVWARRISSEEKLSLCRRSFLPFVFPW